MPADSILTCRDCGQSFTFTAGEQAFYTSRGFSEPSRCPDCRAARKADRGNSGGGYSGGGGGYGGGYGGGQRAGGAPRQMFDATCNSCGNVARVPFQPRGDKPVFCSDCFERRGTGARGGGGYGGGQSRY